MDISEIKIELTKASWQSETSYSFNGIATYKDQEYNFEGHLNYKEELETKLTDPSNSKQMKFYFHGYVCSWESEMLYKLVAKTLNPQIREMAVNTYVKQLEAWGQTVEQRHSNLLQEEQEIKVKIKKYSKLLKKIKTLMSEVKQ